VTISFMLRAPLVPSLVGAIVPGGREAADCTALQRRITIAPDVFKEPPMTLTVRLDDAIRSALERHCAERGVTKSAVVQESLAVYLWGGAASARVARRERAASPVLEAFRRAGLVGAGELGGASADKPAVRARAVRRVRRAAG
jgi:predicted transcriptional regulator